MFEWWRKRRARALFARFASLARQGKTEEAEQALREAHSQYPHFPPFAINLANLTFSRGKPEESIAILEGAPGFPGARPDLLRTWVDLSARSRLRDWRPTVRESLRGIEGDEETRRMVFGTYARVAYWACPGAESTADPAQLALHALAKDLPSSVVGGEMGGPSYWDLLPSEARTGEFERSLQDIDAARAAFHAQAVPILEVESRATRLVDADPFTRASLELLDMEHGVRFLPLSQLEKFSLTPCRMNARVDCTTRQAEQIGAWTPMFYRWTEEHFHLMQIRFTQWQKVYGGLSIPIGPRDYIEVDDTGRMSALVSPAHLFGKEIRVTDRA